MFIFALCVLPVMTARYAGNLWMVVALISLAAASHQAWSANIFTTASDIFPKKAVSSVVGIGGMAGAIGGMLIAEVVGHVLQWTGSYMIPFVMAGSAYLIALFLIHILAPKLEPARMT